MDFKIYKAKNKIAFEKDLQKPEEHLWTTCGCKNLIYKEDMHANQKVCPKCGAHHKLTCERDLKLFLIIQNLN